MSEPAEATRASSLSSHTFHDPEASSNILPKASPAASIADDAKSNDIEKLSVDQNLESEKEEAAQSTEDGNYPGPTSLIFILIATMLSMFLVALDMTIVATAIPQITDDFHSLDQVAWYGSAFFLTLASFQSTWGKGYKYFPLKYTYLLAIFIFELGSLICAVAKNSTTLIVGRAIAGLGAAGIASGVYIIIAFSARPRQRAAFTGLLGATYSVASVAGPLLGGVFTSNVSWRWCFYINLPIGGLSAAIITFFFTTPPAAKPAPASAKEKVLQMDLPGTFTIMAAVICYLLALQWAGVTKAWSDSEIVGLLVGFGLLVIVFIGVEWYSGERALIPFRLMKQRNVAVASAYVLFVVGPMFIMIYYLPIYFQSVKDVSASQSGVRNVPLILSVSLMTIVSGVLITAYGQFAYLMILAGVIATIGAGLIYTFEIDTPSSKWIGYQVLCGIGVGIGCQISIIVNQASVDPSDLANVSAVTLFLQTIGGAFWVSAAQAAFSNKMLQKLPEYAPGVNPQLVIATGATELRSVFSADQLAGILQAYMSGLKVTFLLSIVLGGIATVISLFPKWTSLKGKVEPMGMA
ncbi:putative MFS multidrug transporter [Talaromyces proteolyticus]|uniref:MFS multidrug transporter n=1 Tax=Talaromyces proteolyticus TaxID=1131652 RepID=A0AAD4L0M3_9EURO|nr:putative MFS multidrug transporter [Talaromyces proteolyticus]KAH8704048.1 putative MFS multidrug transporter [Talaromyces proteolyticus]